MPQYHVTKVGFRHGRLYGPQHPKRSTIFELAPFDEPDAELQEGVKPNPKPSWIGQEISVAAEANAAAQVDTLAAALKVAQVAQEKATETAVRTAAVDAIVTENAALEAAKSPAEEIDPGTVLSLAPGGAVISKVGELDGGDVSFTGGSLANSEEAEVSKPASSITETL